MSRMTAQEQQEANRARQWLENLLGLDVGDDFFQALGDGVLLCSILNTIKPGTITKVNPSGRARKFPPKKMENINNFILGARKLGLLKSQLFELPEFLEKKRPDRLVKTLIHLETLAIKAGIDRSAGSNIMQMGKQLEEADLAKQAASALKIAEEESKKEAEAKRLEEEWRKERETGKLQEAEYKARQETLQKEREERARQQKEREEQTRKDKEERDRKAREAAASRPPPAAATGSGGALAVPAKAPGRETSPARSASPSNFSSGPPRTLYGVDALLNWLQQCCYGYAGVDVQNFTSSWKDGLAFCALVHFHAPKELDFAGMAGKTPAERLELAFDVAARLGAPPLLDPEDIYDVPTPERRSMITYFGVLYKAFFKG